MKLQDFHVEAADWANAEQQAALRELRHEVFVLGQNVPEAARTRRTRCRLLARAGA